MRVIEIDDVALHLDAVSLNVDGRSVDITLQEFRILHLLMEEAGRVLSREEILDRAWGANKGKMSNTLSVLVCRLRRKLRRPDGTSRIRTVRAMGYAFDGNE